MRKRASPSASGQRKSTGPDVPSRLAFRLLLLSWIEGARGGDHDAAGGDIAGLDIDLAAVVEGGGKIDIGLA